MIDAKLKLRPYQNELVSNTLASIKSGHRNILNISPTGSGKTVMMVRICEELDKDYDQDDVTLILSHLSLLTDQTGEKFEKFSPIKVGVLQADRFPDNDARVIISTMQSARDFNKIAQLTTVANKKVKTIIVDESHNRFSQSYSDIFSYFPDVPILDFTASPFKNRRLATGFYDDVAFQISLQELIDMKYLVPPVLKQIEFEDDATEKRCAIILRTYLEFEKGKGTICFMRNKQECKLLCDAFTDVGIKARVVTDNVVGENRRNIFKQYDNGEVDVLISVNVLTAGFDSPRCSSVFQFGTESPTTYIQRLGRALRPEDSDSVKPHHKKQFANIYVFGDTPTIKSGSIEKNFTLAVKPKKKDECKDITEVKEWLEDHDLKDSPEYHFIKEAVRVQKIAKKLNMPLIASMLESKSIDEQFLGKLHTAMSGCKSSGDKKSDIELRKALIMATMNNDYYIEDYSTLSENEAKALYKLATGKDYTKFSKDNKHMVKTGKFAGKHVSELTWSYKSYVLKHFPGSELAKLIQSFHESTSQPK